MNKKFLTVAVLVAAVVTAAAKKDSDPTLMTVNGKDVKLSEFEYLYHKNNNQQLQPQTLNDYVDMFVTYKLKVADAEAAGIDTTAAFKKEYEGYRDELARPYLRNQAVEDSIVAATYEHMKENVDVSHIMVALSRDPKQAEKNKSLLDSIRTEILAGRADFGAMADKYSIDPAVKRNHGHMGMIMANRYPYAFEAASYETPVGGISPVIATPFGYHIVKVNGRQPSRGSVLVQHILKLIPKGTPAEVAAKKQAQMDSIYTLLKSGADFSQVASKESEDPGSARKGGMLPWFGIGEMVPEFEKVAFELKNDSISKPFSTSYGIHIVHRIDGKGLAPLEQVKPEILSAMSRDSRGSMADERKLAELKKDYNAHIVEANYDMVKDAISANKGIDSTVVELFINSNAPIFEVAGVPTPLSKVMYEFRNLKKLQELYWSLDAWKGTVERAFDKTVFDYEKTRLDSKYADFRNLANEYRDGMLLFEISNRKVWDKASRDKEGLEKFFEANRSKYTWKAPKYKGFVIFTTNDSIDNAVKTFLAENKPAADSVARDLRGKFGRNVKVERVIATRGENAVVDNIAFGGKAPDLSSDKWKHFVAYQGEVIDNPEEASDVRGQVTTDYQAQLEKEWVESLHKTYKWKVNKKVLKKVK